MPKTRSKKLTVEIPTTPLTNKTTSSRLASMLVSQTPTNLKLAKGSKQHLIDSNYLFIVSWLEDTTNQNSIFGTPKSTKVGSANCVKNVGLTFLANALNKHSKGWLALTHSGIGG